MMERLTRRIQGTNEADCAYCKAEFQNNGNCNNCPLRQLQTVKLAAYEDLGTVEALYALVKAKEEGRLIPYGPGDAVWDRFGRIWGVSSSEIRLLDGKPTPMYRCGHPGTDDYCALWAHEALDKEAGAKAAKVWAAEIATYFPCKAVTRVEAQAALERVEKHLASCTNPDCPYQPTKNCPAADGCGGYAALERMEET